MFGDDENDKNLISPTTHTVTFHLTQKTSTIPFWLDKAKWKLANPRKSPNYGRQNLPNEGHPSPQDSILADFLFRLFHDSFACPNPDPFPLFTSRGIL